MTYVFPKILAPLREYLRGQGADVNSFVTARQAAFMAQQLIGSRVKFPPQGQDMTMVLLDIQKAVPANAKPIVKSKKRTTKGQVARAAKHHIDFKPEMFAEGIHIFCDGAAVPNPGLGGWGVAVYRDGIEIDSAHGGEVEATNNQMELTALLVAIGKAADMCWNGGPGVTIWCDSQYCVKGVNEWRHGWKSKGWQRGGENAEPKNRVLMNADLWMAIDDAIPEHPDTKIKVRWCKGHIGIAGNERADELAEIGRQEAEEISSSLRASPGEDLDAQYRQIMGAM